MVSFLKFTIPVPPEPKYRAKKYSADIREKAWGAVRKIPATQWKNWPFDIKDGSKQRLHCAFTVYRETPYHDVAASLVNVVQTIGRVLWNPKTVNPVLHFTQILSETGNKIEIKVYII